MTSVGEKLAVPWELRSQRDLAIMGEALREIAAGGKRPRKIAADALERVRRETP